MAGRPWMLAELTYADLKNSVPSIAVLPFGATEPHNLHLPYSTDTIEADAIAEAICRHAYERGAPVVCLPTVPYGTETNQYAFPLSMNLQPSTIALIVRDLVATLERSGMKHCLILNSHGGNEFKGILRELFLQTSVKLFLCNWFKVLADEYFEVFTHKDDHAGEMETSIVMALRPDLVDLAKADHGGVNRPRLRALERGWVEMSRPWHLLTTNSGAGNPSQASPAKGRAWLERVIPVIADFLVELSALPVDQHFPYEPA